MSKDKKSNVVEFPKKEKPEIIVKTSKEYAVYSFSEMLLKTKELVKMNYRNASLPNVVFELLKDLLFVLTGLEQESEEDASEYAKRYLDQMSEGTTAFSKEVKDYIDVFLSQVYFTGDKLQ